MKHMVITIGCSANYLLQDRDDLIDIFIYAPEEDRIRAIMENQSVSEKKGIPWLAQNAQKVSPGNLVNTPGSRLVTTEESLEKLYESML